ncbi:ABC transporter ATP-binding protein [Actinobacillus equuli]|nr:ABC transporter ATP-binding protein [Actinobacillus equuli]
MQREQGLTNLFQQIAAQGFEVSSMRNKSNRLEELFMKMAN